MQLNPLHSPMAIFTVKIFGNTTPSLSTVAIETMPQNIFEKCTMKPANQEPYSYEHIDIRLCYITANFWMPS